MKNVFQSTAYRTRAEMVSAIAEIFLCANGLNSRADMLGALHNTTDADLARECIKGWGLDQIDQTEQDRLEYLLDEDEWAEKRAALQADLVTVAELTDAFALLRADFDVRFPAEA